MGSDELTEGEIDEILSLYRQTTTERTTTFDIIDRAGDERTHTKFLRWMCDPDGSHGLDATFLNHCLDVAGGTQSSIEEIDGATVNSVSAFSRKPDETELDILIETGTRMIVFEIKTQSSLRHKQIDAQTRYLQKQVEKNAINSWDYILLTQDNINPKSTYPNLYWSDIHRGLATLVGKVESDIDALRLRDWMRAIDKDLLDQRDFGPDSRLALQYGEKLDQLGIPYDSEAHIDDRIQLFKRLREWLREQYELSSGSSDGWTSRTLQSRFEKGSDIYRISKHRWEDEGIRFEILARDKRLKRGTDHDPEHGYRSTDSLIEVTLRYKISKQDTQSSPENPTSGAQQRKRLHDKLKQDGHWESLQAAGFQRTRTLLPEDQPLSRYHMYSRQIPVFEQDGKGVFAAVRDAVAALMDTRESIDKFVETEEIR
ncbi:PD-(D/E)XK nuclease family protein [Halapricum desulfuricans]|nr:PD-(D/E)XK nuclease family protein [Halapricum desulfuricans]